MLPARFTCPFVIVTSNQFLEKRGFSHSDDEWKVYMTEVKLPLKR